MDNNANKPKENRDELFFIIKETIMDTLMLHATD